MGAILGRLVGTYPLACVVNLSELGGSVAWRVSMTAFAGAAALGAGRSRPLGAAAGAGKRSGPAGTCREGRPPRPRAGLRAVADHPAPGGAAQGRAEPGRHPGFDEAHVEPGPVRDRLLDRRPGRPRRPSAHLGRAAAARPRRGLGVGAVTSSKRSLATLQMAWSSLRMAAARAAGLLKRAGSPSSAVRRAAVCGPMPLMLASRVPVSCSWGRRATSPPRSASLRRHRPRSRQASRAWTRQATPWWARGPRPGSGAGAAG